MSDFIVVLSGGATVSGTVTFQPQSVSHARSDAVPDLRAAGRPRHRSDRNRARGPTRTGTSRSKACQRAPPVPFSGQLAGLHPEIGNVERSQRHRHPDRSAQRRVAFRRRDRLHRPAERDQRHAHDRTGHAGLGIHDSRVPNRRLALAAAGATDHDGASRSDRASTAFAVSRRANTISTAVDPAEQGEWFEPPTSTSIAAGRAADALGWRRQDTGLESRHPLEPFSFRCRSGFGPFANRDPSDRCRSTNTVSVRHRPVWVTLPRPRPLARHPRRSAAGSRWARRLGRSARQLTIGWAAG